MANLSAAIAERKHLTPERLREVLTYDEATGVFRWKIRVAQRAKAGDVAGSAHSDGYRHIRVDGAMYKLHRLAWLYVYGRWPSAHIDHVNGIRDDNRLANLREADNAQNHQNKKRAQSNNASGYLGVCWHSQNRKWRAQIQAEGKKVQLGYFDTPEEAHAAYLKAKAELHPFQTITTKDAD